MKYTGSDDNVPDPYPEIEKKARACPLLACWHCKYFVHERAEWWEIEGECRRFPPRRMPNDDERDDRSGCPGDYEFPKVFFDAWCGEFQRKKFLPEWIDQAGAKFHFLTWECTIRAEPENDVVQISFGTKCYDFPAWYVCELIDANAIIPRTDEKTSQEHRDS